jgi:serine/threonine-protein kinase
MDLSSVASMLGSDAPARGAAPPPAPAAKATPRKPDISSPTNDVTAPCDTDAQKRLPLNSAAAAAPTRALATASSSSNGNDDTDDDGFLAPQTVIGNFRIEGPLGVGGMAHVYKATQLSLKRPVALKILASRLARKPGFVERFDREAGALASLSHPNIVNVIDKGRAGDLYYFAMELVDGITLDQLIQSVDLTPRHYTHVIAEISKALSYVHELGIIHRDIKPANVLVTRHGVVKVSDFGIAHITEGAAEGKSDTTNRSSSVGTQHYMSPEQTRDSDSVDARADIYSLAVTFYKMFTRQLPATVWQPPTTLNPKLPLDIDAVISRAMAQDPDERHATVKEFCDAVLAVFNPALRPQDPKKNFQPPNQGVLSTSGLFSGTSGTRRAASTPAPAAEGDGSDSGAMSALFRPAFVMSNFDLEPGTPFPSSSTPRRGTPAAQPNTPAAPKTAPPPGKSALLKPKSPTTTPSGGTPVPTKVPVVEVNDDTPLLSRPMFWVATISVVVFSAACIFLILVLLDLI